MDKHWTEHDIKINNINLHYYRTGKGVKKTLILVHGFSDNGLCWTQVARALEDEYDVIMPDMRGHGLSSRYSETETLDMASDLAELIKELGLAKPVVGGHSMGSMVTYELAIRYRELPGALFFVDPLWWIGTPFGNPGNQAPEENPIATWAKTLQDIPLDELIKGYREDNPAWSDELIRIMCEAKKQLDMGIVDVLSEKMHRQEWDWQEEVKKFPQPFLLFSGETEKGGFITPEVSARVKEIRPDAMTLQVPDVGHLIHFDGFPVFMEGLKRFLASVDL
ncbi:alpha/beta fold hydrolase [Spirochaeta isovalerica]|uniref:Pimeloyl-ACP methyl ester carboxylesterase n=1 Tax=Spirochaeta isovalerica TaxID=150 RepID=A0A841R471_9SPIO|nr:alpha/beta hydrolase [Spirochaeta isovalerica]MBB6479904.1 pimeloyl-ACP methyl ester carboxylesterase [Spirochaeta isovalerica]